MAIPGLLGNTVAHAIMPVLGENGRVSRWSHKVANDDNMPSQGSATFILLPRGKAEQSWGFAEKNPNQTYINSHFIYIFSVVAMCVLLCDFLAVKCNPRTT